MINNNNKVRIKISSIIIKCLVLMCAVNAFNKYRTVVIHANNKVYSFIY